MKNNLELEKMNFQKCREPLSSKLNHLRTKTDDYKLNLMMVRKVIMIYSFKWIFFSKGVIHMINSNKRISNNLKTLMNYKITYIRRI